MSIRVRLGLWYGGIFGVALLLLGLLLYVLMARHLESMVQDAVTDRAARLVTTIRSANPEAQPGSVVSIPSLDTFEVPEVYVQVLTLDSKVLDRSSNLQGRSLPLPQGGLGQGEYSASLDDVNMKASLTPVMAGGRTIGWVQVAASYRQRDKVLDQLKWALIGGGLGGVLIVGLLSGAIAGRALRPVSEMTETARAIALSRGFSRRLSAGNPNDELGQLSLTFNEMLASLEEAYSAQQRFTADASHELRAPLTAIRGNLDLLDRIKDMHEDERRQTLAQVRREVERLSRLVNDLLSLARADAGHGLDVRPVELDVLLVEAHRQARTLANGIIVRLDSLEPCLVQGDEDRLKELLLILVDNALRYTSEGGTVTLGLQCQSPWAVVSVADTGMGIEPDDLSHVFDRFWRADRARASDSGGTGLGLAIARWIVERHGGEILVDSVPGEGTRFFVHLPAKG